MFNIENEILPASDENFNKIFLTNGGVCATFLNAFTFNEGQLPRIKSKLRRVLVDFGLSQTYLELQPNLGIINVYYVDKAAQELKGVLLQKYNKTRHNQAVELNIKIEGQSAQPLKLTEDKVRVYNGLTKLLYQDFIQPTEPTGLLESVEYYHQLKTLIKQGNQAPTMPLKSIFRGEVG